MARSVAGVLADARWRVVLWAFSGWEQRMISQGREPLVDPALLKVVHLRAGLLAFFFQFLLLLGLFFLMSLY